MDRGNEPVSGWWEEKTSGVWMYLAHTGRAHRWKPPLLPSQGPRAAMSPGIVPFPPLWAQLFVLTLPKALWSPISVSPSSLEANGGNCWVFWVQLKQKGCMSSRYLHTLSRDHTCDAIGHLSAQGPSCSSQGCVPYAELMKSRCTRITTSEDVCWQEATPPPKGKGRGIPLSKIKDDPWSSFQLYVSFLSS